jgi:hypothetical protein
MHLQQPPKAPTWRYRIPFLPPSPLNKNPNPLVEHYHRDQITHQKKMLHLSHCRLVRDQTVIHIREQAHNPKEVKHYTLLLAELHLLMEEVSISIGDPSIAEYPLPPIKRTVALSKLSTKRSKILSNAETWSSNRAWTPESHTCGDYFSTCPSHAHSPS